MPAAIDFYFDFASPYAYLASTRIDELAARHGRSVDWRPILLGPTFARTGARPLMTQPVRGDYARRDLPRFARHLGVPFAFPPIMPIAALAAARAVYWLREEGDPPLANRLAKALCRAHFGEGRDIQAPGQVAEVAAPLGIDGEALQAGIGRRSVKDRLRAETEESLARGVFGAPFVFVDGEPFWGADRLDQVEAWLARGGF